MTDQDDDDDEKPVVKNFDDNDGEELEANEIKRKKNDKDKNAQRSNIPWTDNLICHLLTLAINEKAHTTKKSKTSKLWDNINDAFFDHPELAEFRSDLYKKGDHRKIRDKYRNIITAAKNDMEVSSLLLLSKNGGVCKQNDLIKQIIFDMNNNPTRCNDEAIDGELTDVKRRKVDAVINGHDGESSSSSSELLNNVRIVASLNGGVDVHNRNNNSTAPATQASAKGSSINNSHSAATTSSAQTSSSVQYPKPTPSTSAARHDDYHHHNVFDAVVTRLLNEISSDSDRATLNHESKVEELLLKWIHDRRKNLQSLISDSNILHIDEYSLKALNDLTLDVIINIYCSRNHNFSPTVFKAALIEDMKVSPLIVHKIYATLEKWRKLCHREEGSGNKAKEWNFNIKISSV